MESEVRKRVTRQLSAVHEALRGDHTHPSADEIYRRVREQLPRISLGTVYRNLQRLVEDGKIRALVLGERVARFDPVVADHDHFICERCRRVEDISLGLEDQVDLGPLRECGFRVKSVSVGVHGLCQTCALSAQGGREKEVISGYQ